jgi:hypothetical protein
VSNSCTPRFLALAVGIPAPCLIDCLAVISNEQAVSGYRSFQRKHNENRRNSLLEPTLSSVRISAIPQLLQRLLSFKIRIRPRLRVSRIWLNRLPYLHLVFLRPSLEAIDLQHSNQKPSGPPPRTGSYTRGTRSPLLPYTPRNLSRCHTEAHETCHSCRTICTQKLLAHLRLQSSSQSDMVQEFLRPESKPRGVQESTTNVNTSECFFCSTLWLLIRLHRLAWKHSIRYQISGEHIESNVSVTIGRMVRKQFHPNQN